MTSKPSYRINIKNANIAFDEAALRIRVARIYGSGVLMEDMLRTMKKEYNRLVGQGYYGGVSEGSPRNLMRDLEITNYVKGIREIRVRPGSTVPQSNTGPNTKTNTKDILDLIQKGWAEPSKRKVFKLGPGRKNLQGVTEGWMEVTAQKPKPFVANTVAKYKGMGITSAKAIMEKEMAKSLERGMK